MAAGKGRKIVVEFIGDDKSLSKTAAKVEGTTGKLGGRLAKVGVIAGGALVAGVGAAGVALAGMAKNAAEDEAGQRRLAVALKNTAGATAKQTAGVEDWISKQGKALGVTDDQLRPAFQRLAQSTGDIGKAQKLAAVAMDASAGSGKSLETVSTAIAKAQNGNMGALSRLGVKIKDADGKALSFNDAMKEMSKTFGGQAAAKANSFDGQMARLQLTFDETKEAIGAKLLPVATKLASWFLDKGLPAISKFAGMLQKKLGPVIDQARGFLKKFSGEGDATSSKFQAMIGKLKGIFGSVASIVKSVVSIVQSLWKRFGSTLVSFTAGTFKNVVNAISGAFKIIAGIFKVIASVLKGDWKGAWDGIKQIVSGAWQVIKAVVSQGWNILKSLFSVGIAALKGLFTGLWNALKSAVTAGWNGIKSLVGGMWTGMRSIFTSAGSALQTTFAGIWTGLKQKATDGIQAIVDGVRSLPSKLGALASSLKNAGKKLVDDLLAGIANAGGLASDFASKIWAAIKRIVNAGIDRLNNLLEFDYKLPKILGGGTIGIDMPDIPHLYRGGIVKGSRAGTPIVAGDRGYDEMVVPLNGPHAPKLGGGGVTINISGALDPVAVGRQVEQIMVQYQRTTGRQLAFV